MFGDHVDHHGDDHEGIMAGFNPAYEVTESQNSSSVNISQSTESTTSVLEQVLAEINVFAGYVSTTGASSGEWNHKDVVAFESRVSEQCKGILNHLMMLCNSDDDEDMVEQDFSASTGNQTITGFQVSVI